MCLIHAAAQSAAEASSARITNFQREGFDKAMRKLFLTLVLGSALLAQNSVVRVDNNGRVASNLLPTSASPAFTIVGASASPTFAVTAGTAQGFKMTLNANVDAITTTGATAGQYITLRLCQPSSGGPYTVAFPAAYVGAGVIDTTPSSCSTQTFQYDGSNYNAVGPMNVTGATPGVYFGATTSDPASPSNGMVWHRSDLNELRTQLGGSVKTLATADQIGGQANEYLFTAGSSSSSYVVTHGLGAVAQVARPCRSTVDNVATFYTPTSFTASSANAGTLAFSPAPPTGTKCGLVAGDPYVVPSAAVYRFRVGSSTPYTDTLGNVWDGDTNGYIYPGNHDSDANTITNTADPTLYSNLKYDSPTLYVTLPVSPGTYTVKLKFAEPYYTSAGSRVFHIDIDGVRKLSNFDIYADAGAAHKADDKTFVVNAAGPYLVVALNAVTGHAMINAVEVTR